MDASSILIWIIVILVLAISLWPAARISRKAGYSGWWALVMLVPLGNVIVIWVFAFLDWPNLR